MREYAKKEEKEEEGICSSRSKKRKLEKEKKIHNRHKRVSNKLYRPRPDPDQAIYQAIPGHIQVIPRP